MHPEKNNMEKYFVSIVITKVVTRKIEAFDKDDAVEKVKQKLLQSPQRILKSEIKTGHAYKIDTDF